ncbi:MAG: hypothetical protein ABR514_05660 [Chthoniobacterales bacterium]
MAPFSRRPLRSIATALLISVLIGCGGPSREIVGKWRSSADRDAIVWEFASNGRVLIGNTRGKYTFGDGDRVKIETPFSTSVYHVEISHDRMTFGESTGSRMEFTRIK